MTITAPDATAPGSANEWATQLLTQWGMPTTKSNINALIKWSNYEAGPWGNQPNTTSEKNPLSSSLAMGGSQPFNSSGVQAYPNWQTSYAATIATLNQPNMASIRQSFAGGNASATLPGALENAQWAGTSPQANQAYAGSISGALGAPLGPQAPGGVSTNGTVGCNSSVYLINASPFHLINQCQQKALKGGLLALAGGVLMLAGVALVISKTGIGNKVVEGTGVGFIAGKVASRTGADYPSGPIQGNPASYRQRPGAAHPPSAERMARRRQKPRTWGPDEDPDELPF